MNYPTDEQSESIRKAKEENNMAWPGTPSPSWDEFDEQPTTVEATSGPVTEAPYCPIHQSYKPCEHYGGVRQEDGPWRWPSEAPHPVADREAFEAWIEDQFDHPPQDREEPLTKDGAYHAYLWRTWQAAHSQALAGFEEVECICHPDGERDYSHRCNCGLCNGTGKLWRKS